MEKEILKLKDSVFSSKFRSFLRKTIKKEIDNIRSYQKFCIFYKYISITFCFLIVCLIINYQKFIFIFILPHLFVLLYLIYNYLCSYFVRQIKLTLFPKIFSFFGNVRICNKRKIDELREYIWNTEILACYSIFICDDYFKINYNDIDISIADLIRKKKDCNDVGPHSILITFPLKKIQNKKFKLIVENKNIRVLRLFIDKVNLEDSEFEKHFNVYSNDQIESRSILTPAFMSRLIKIDNKYQTGFSIEKGNVNIVISSTKDWFEIPFFDQPEKLSLYKDVIMDLIFLLSIIDSLKIIK